MQDFDEMQAWAREASSLTRKAARAVTVGRALCSMLGEPQHAASLNADDHEAVVKAADAMGRVFIDARKALLDLR